MRFGDLGRLSVTLIDHPMKGAEPAQSQFLWNALPPNSGPPVFVQKRKSAVTEGKTRHAEALFTEGFG